MEPRANYASVLCRVEMLCEGCGQPTVLTQVGETSVCRHCGRTMVTSPLFWQRMLTRALAEALTLPEGKGRSVWIRTRPPVQTTSGRLSPRCAGPCASPLPKDALGGALAEGRSQLFCPECGTSVLLRQTPAWFAALHPAASFLVGEQSRGDSTAGKPLLPRAFDGSFYVLLNTRGAVAPLPTRVRALSDFVPDLHGLALIAYHAYVPDPRPHPARLGAVDRRGLFRWVTDEIDFSEDTRIFPLWTSDAFLLVDRARGAVHRVHTGNGALLELLQDAGSARDRLCVRHHRGITLDHDDTLVVLHNHGSGLLVERYGLDGRRLPLWPGTRIAAEHSSRHARTPEWHRLSHRPLLLPKDALFTIGADGFAYCAAKSGSAVVRFTPEGKRDAVFRLDPTVVRSIESIGVDAEGTIFLLFSHARPLGGLFDKHIGRMLADGTFETWAGAHAPRSQRLLGSGVRAIRVGEDGTVFVVGTLDQLRILSRDAHVVWESPLAALDDQSLREELVRALRTDASRARKHA